jgi:hypothetical protein
VKPGGVHQVRIAVLAQGEMMMLATHSQRQAAIRFLRRLRRQKIMADEFAAPWFETGKNHPVSLSLYHGHLHNYGVRFRSGTAFVCIAPGNLVRLLWKRRGEYFARELSTDEAGRFFELAGVTAGVDELDRLKNAVNEIRIALRDIAPNSCADFVEAVTLILANRGFEIEEE